MIAAISGSSPAEPLPFVAVPQPGFAEALADHEPATMIAGLPVSTDTEREDFALERDEDDAITPAIPVFVAVAPPVIDPIVQPATGVASRPRALVDSTLALPTGGDTDGRLPAGDTRVAVEAKSDDLQRAIRLDDRASTDTGTPIDPAPAVDRDSAGNPAERAPRRPVEGHDPESDGRPLVTSARPDAGAHRTDPMVPPPSPPDPPRRLPPPAERSSPVRGPAKRVDATAQPSLAARSEALPAADTPAAATQGRDPTIAAPVPSSKTAGATPNAAVRPVRASTDRVEPDRGAAPRDLADPRSAPTIAPTAQDRPSDRPPATASADPRALAIAAAIDPTQHTAPFVAPARATPVDDAHRAGPDHVADAPSDVTVTTEALGEVSAAVTSRVGETDRLSVRFAVEREATAAMIAAGDGLHRALALAGATLETISIDVRGERSGGGATDPRDAQSPTRDGQADARHPPYRAPDRPRTARPAATASAPRRDRFA